MSGNPQITATMTVREVMTRYPRAERIFNKHGLTGCGGPKGPIEPLAFFAKVHGVDPEGLLAELNDLARQPGAEDVPAEATGAAVELELYRPFVKAALVIALTVGCTLGALSLAAMALSATVSNTWPALVQAHGHAQIFGWVGLFIMGVAYHTLPRLKSTEIQGRGLALASFPLILGGLSLRMVAQPLSTSPVFAWLVVASAVAELVGVSLFVLVMARTLASNAEAADFYDKYIVASLVWFWALSAGTVALSLYTLSAGVDLIPAHLDVPYLHVGLMGFAAMMIFGYALRTVPAFMGLRSPDRRTFDAIFWVLNAAIVVRVGAWLAAPGLEGAQALGALAGAVEWLAVVAFVYSLNLFRRPEVDVSEAGPPEAGGYEKYIKAAFFWLLVAATMSAGYAIYEGLGGRAVPHSLVGAYRHALTVGFISMTIIGMSSRIIPVFAGVRLYSQALLLGSFVLLNVGNTVRVLTQPLADFVGGPFFVAMGVSGFVEVTALALFGYNLWRTIDSPLVDEEPVAAAGAITQDTVVADVLARYPQTLPVFVDHGFTALLNPVARRTLARAVTLGEAVRIHPANLDRLLADLNRAAGLAAPLTDRGQGDSLRIQVEAALEGVRPYLQADGGDIELVAVGEGGTVSVRLTGACGGCAFSQQTLTAGVERALKEQVPSVQRVVSVDAT